MMNKKRVVISVISDLVTDQRVHRTATTLHKLGFDVLLVGRQLPNSAQMDVRAYPTKRFKLPVNKGVLFYAFYNIRLFLFLLFQKTDLLFANDLDTLPANYLISKWKRKKLIYDSHEYFTGVPELVARPNVQRIWKWLEKKIVPKLDHLITVNHSIANLFEKEYGKQFVVIRNLPVTKTVTLKKSRAEFGIPEGKSVFLFQGAGINIDRGAEEAIEAISHVDAILLFIGGGDVLDSLQKLVREKNLEQKVFFIPKQPMELLIAFTSLADFGLTLDKDTNINYRFSLPNKLFDYIQARLPILASDLPEVSAIVKGYEIGIVTASHDPLALAEEMKNMMNNEKFARWKENLNLAASELCWEKEESKLIELITNATD